MSLPAAQLLPLAAVELWNRTRTYPSWLVVATASYRCVACAGGATSYYYATTVVCSSSSIRIISALLLVVGSSGGAAGHAGWWIIIAETKLLCVTLFVLLARVRVRL